MWDKVSAEIHLSSPDKFLRFIKLFRGYVQYSEPLREVLSKILRRVLELYLVVQKLLCVRSKLAFFNRSDLEASKTFNTLV